MKDINKIRESFLKYVRPELSSMSFDTWFTPIGLHGVDEGSKTIYITAENDFSANILNKRYIDVIEKSFQKVMKENYKVVIKTPESYRHEDEHLERVNEIKNEEPLKSEGTDFSRQRITHPEYMFDNFVVGSGNKYAHAAALAVAESPAKAYNPLFIYGGSGLGKTHLMHAIAIYLSEHRPELNVLYVSSEMFTNELIKALGENKQREFKNKEAKGRGFVQ
jgi:chromosomal replication initiator protein